MAGIRAQIEYDADLSKLERKFDAFGVRQQRKSAKSLQEGFAKGAREAGKKTAKELLKGYRAELQARQGALKEQLARGLIDRRAFQKAGRDLRRDFNRGIIAAQAELGKQGRLTAADNRLFQRSLFAVGEESRKTSRKVRTLRQTFMSLRLAVTGTVALIGVGIARALIGTISKFEQLQARLRTVTGSAHGAHAALNEIKQLAIETPFEVEKLTEAFTTLTATGVVPTREEMTGLGNVAAGFGRDITDVVTAAVSREREVFKRWGIDLRQSGDEIRVSYKGIEETIDNSTEAIVEYLARLGNVEFAGAMAEQMDTIAGATSNLKDAWDDLVLTWNEGLGLGGAITRFLQGIGNALSQMASQSRAMAAVELGAGVGAMVTDLAKAEQLLADLRGMKVLDERRDMPGRDAAIRELEAKIPILRAIDEAEKQRLESEKKAGIAAEEAAEAQAAAAEKMAEHTREVGEEVARLIEQMDPEKVEAFADEIRAAAEDLVEAKRALETATATGDIGAILDAQRGVAGAEQRAQGVVTRRLAEPLAAFIPQFNIAKPVTAALKPTREMEKSWGNIEEFIEGVGKGVVSVLDGTGRLDADTRRVLRGVIDIAEAYRQIRTLMDAGGSLFSAGGLGALTAGLGGLVGVIGGLFGGGGEAERLREKQIEAMKRLENALDDLRDTIQPDVNPAAVRGAMDRVRGTGERIGQIAQLPTYASQTLLDKQQQEWRDLLESLGPGAEALRREVLADDVISPQEAQKIWEAAEAALDNIGLFPETMEGQLDAMAYRFQALGDAAGDADARMAHFIDVIEQFSPEAARTLRGMTPDEQREQLREWALALATGGATLDAVLATLGITAAELAAMVDAGRDIADGGGPGASQGVQVARAITEIQAVEVVAWLETIALTLRQMLSVISGQQPAQLASVGASLPSTILSPNGGPPGSEAVAAAVTSMGNSVSVGHVDVRAPIDPDTFLEMWTEAGEEVLRRAGVLGSGGGFELLG